MCWRFAEQKTQRCGGGKASTMYCRLAPVNRASTSGNVVNQLTKDASTCTSNSPRPSQATTRDRGEGANSPLSQGAPSELAATPSGLFEAGCSHLRKRYTEVSHARWG